MLCSKEGVTPMGSLCWSTVVIQSFNCGRWQLCHSWKVLCPPHLHTLNINVLMTALIESVLHWFASNYNMYSLYCTCAVKPNVCFSHFDLIQWHLYSRNCRQSFLSKNDAVMSQCMITATLTLFTFRLFVKYMFSILNLLSTSKLVAWFSLDKLKKAAVSLWFLCIFSSGGIIFYWCDQHVPDFSTIDSSSSHTHSSSTQMQLYSKKKQNIFYSCPVINKPITL